MRANQPHLETETLQTDPHCARALVHVTDASFLLQLQSVAQTPALQSCTLNSTRSGRCCFGVHQRHSSLRQSRESALLIPHEEKMALFAHHRCFGHHPWVNVFLWISMWSIMRKRNISYLKKPYPKSTCIARYRAFLIFEMPVGILQQKIAVRAVPKGSLRRPPLHFLTQSVAQVFGARVSREKAKTRLHPQSTRDHASGRCSRYRR